MIVTTNQSRRNSSLFSAKLGRIWKLAFFFLSVYTIQTIFGCSHTSLLHPDSPFEVQRTNDSWWSSTEVSNTVLQAHTQHDHTPASPPVSPEQTTTPRNWFFPLFFLASCLVEAFYFFPLTVSFIAVLWQSTDSTDRKSIQSHPSRRYLSSYLHISTAPGVGRTQVGPYKTKSSVSPLFSGSLSQHQQPQKGPLGGMIIVLFC